MLKRDEALQVLAIHVPDAIVVPVFQAAFDWMQIRPNPLNYLCTGAMGQASSHALGLALGLPGERIIVLDGDGSLLMNLGSLVTIGQQAPENLFHFVFSNGIYEVNGRYPIPGGGVVRFDQMAIAAGYKHACLYSDLETFRSEIGSLLMKNGPILIDLRVETGAAHPRDYVTLHSAASRARFRAAVKSRIPERTAG